MLLASDFFDLAQASVGPGLLDHERLAARSERMAAVLDPLAQQAHAAADLEALRETVEQAEQVMATENHERGVSLSFRIPSVPI